MGEVQVEPFSFLTGWCACTAPSVGSFLFMLKSSNREQDLFSRMRGSHCMSLQNFRSNNESCSLLFRSKASHHCPTGFAAYDRDKRREEIMRPFWQDLFP